MNVEVVSDEFADIFGDRGHRYRWCWRFVSIGYQKHLFQFSPQPKSATPARAPS